jgi:hypothetical protein
MTAAVEDREIFAIVPAKQNRPEIDYEASGLAVQQGSIFDYLVERRVAHIYAGCVTNSLDNAYGHSSMLPSEFVPMPIDD